PKSRPLRPHQRSDVAAANQRDSRAGFRQIYYRQANEQRNRGDDFKVQDRLCPHAADLLQIAATGDSDDQRRKNQWRNDRFDEIEKNVAKEKNIVAPFRTDVAERATQNEADQNLRGQ